MATRTVDILSRLQRITNALEQGISQPYVISEMEELCTIAETIAIPDLSGHVEQILSLLDNPPHGLHDMLEEIRIVEEFLQSDEYGFREHRNSWRYF